MRQLSQDGHPDQAYQKDTDLDGKCLRDLPPYPPCYANVTSTGFQSVHSQWSGTQHPAKVLPGVEGKKPTKSGKTWLSVSNGVRERSWSKWENVKINICKLHLKWSWKPRRENSHPHTTQKTLLTPIRTNIPCISYKKQYYLLPQQKGLPSKGSANERLS